VAELALAALALVAGALVTWILARAHYAAAAAAERQAREARLAGAERLEEELRSRLDKQETDLSDLHKALADERALRTEAQTRADTARQGLEEQRQSLEEAHQRLADTFKSLSAEALSQSNAAFLVLADERLSHRHADIDASVKPLQDALARYEQQIRELERARQGAYSSLETQVKSLSEQAGSLAIALRNPQARGRWGELTLRRVAELAGMAAHCDFVEQATTEGESGRLRPDMIVRLPAGRQIVVDAKVPLAAYLESLEAATSEARRTALERHAQQVRAHVQTLAGKAYWESIGSALDLVVMFIPGESFFGAAVEADPSIIDDALGRRVAIASPMTLVALLRAIELGWKEERLAADARKITDEGRELYRRLATFLQHFVDVGTALGRAAAVYDQAVGSMQLRVLPQARQLRDLAAVTGDEAPALQAIQKVPRQLAVPELPVQAPLVTDDPPGGQA
jgi:DNA recombination protein RmuC